VAGKWYPSYPETTGYIIPTFFDYADFSGDNSYRDRAIQMAVWLLSLQLENGAFPGPPWIEPKDGPVVFDTGQIIHGLVRAYEETGDLRFMDAAIHAGDWLVGIQEDDGSWWNYDMDQAHTYNSRTAWALLRIDQANRCNQYYVAAQNNLNWVLSQQTSDGWFFNASFDGNEDPLTHTIAYTIEGLLEAGRLLLDQRFIEAARLSADALRDLQVQGGHLPGKFQSGWQPGVSWSCLTGNAQMAFIWLKLYEMTNETDYLQAATIANQYLKQVQSLSANTLGIRGGVSGSDPIYGDYGSYLYLNWAAKFFADSLMQAEFISGEKQKPAHVE